MVTDDFSVLTAMVDDMRTADHLYQPTNYWQVYFDRFYPILLKEGLSSFRASGYPVYRSMGVSGKPFMLVEDLRQYWFPDKPYLQRLILNLLTATGVFSKLNGRSTDCLDHTFIAFQNALFQLALQPDPDDEILRIQDSAEGAPRDYFHPDQYPNQGYTISFLRNFLEYRWAQRFVDFRQVAGMLEIGGGYGAQAEVLLKLHPNITKYVLCDIPPQLYIQECYLKAVFPGEVTGFMETRDLSHIDLSTTKRIVVLPPWQLPNVVGSFDMFWNSASFQEMEPEVVENYAKIVTQLVKRYVYLKEDPTGRRVAEKEGDVGVFTPILLTDYERYFSEFVLVQIEDCLHITCMNPHAAPLLDSRVYDQMLFERT